MTTRSMRKALKEVSNNNHSNAEGRGGGGGGGLSKSVGLKMKKKKEIDKPQTVMSQEEEKGGGRGEDSCLDRLLLVHSDLSSLTRQIDELVAQAFKVKETNKQGRKEIESFTHVLSDMLSTLKPWVPRFQKVLSSSIVDPEYQLEEALADKITVSVAVNEDENFEVDSPEQTKDMDSLISPSPLVSWRADCNIERGRQLFLLTPLPISKTVSSFKCQDFSKSEFEKVASNPAVELPSFLTTSGDVNGNLPEGIEVKPISSKLFDYGETEAKSTFEFGFVPSPTFSRRDHSRIVMTPCLKMSPPKSCMLLEPISELSHKCSDAIRKATPFPVGIHSQVSESSDSGGSEDLASKYPELLGIQQAFKCRMGKKELEASPHWSFSPPKTCVLLEPPDEKSMDIVAADYQLPITAPVLNRQTNLTSLKQYDDQEPIGSSLKLVESTPLWKESESTRRTRRRPGENTLKKELWTKFEAASTYGLRLHVSEFQGTAQKGFLDMLDEVSCDGESLEAGLR